MNILQLLPSLFLTTSNTQQVDLPKQTHPKPRLTHFAETLYHATPFSKYPNANVDLLNLDKKSEEEPPQPSNVGGYMTLLGAGIISVFPIIKHNELQQISFAEKAETIRARLNIKITEIEGNLQRLSDQVTRLTNLQQNQTSQVYQQFLKKYKIDILHETKLQLHSLREEVSALKSQAVSIAKVIDLTAVSLRRNPFKNPVSNAYLERLSRIENTTLSTSGTANQASTDTLALYRILHQRHSAPNQLPSIQDLEQLISIKGRYLSKEIAKMSSQIKRALSQSAGSSALNVNYLRRSLNHLIRLKSDASDLLELYKNLSVYSTHQEMPYDDEVKLDQVRDTLQNLTDQIRGLTALERHLDPNEVPTDDESVAPADNGPALDPDLFLDELESSEEEGLGIPDTIDL